MNHRKNIPFTNDTEWYLGSINIKSDRLSVLAIIGMIELTMRHPNLPATTREETRYLGRQLIFCLIEDGMIVPDDVMEAWNKAFRLTPYERESSKDIDKSEPVKVVFIGMQDNLPGKPSIPLYNITGGKHHGSTVSSKTLKALGIKVPDPDDHNIPTPS